MNRGIRFAEVNLSNAKGHSMIRKSGYRFSEKHALGLDPRDHAQTINYSLNPAPIASSANIFTVSSE